MRKFLINETFFPEFHSGLIWIQTVFANVNRETGTCTPFQENQSASTDRQVERERERERGGLFEFRHFFNSENSSTYFKVSCISLQKILIDEITL